MGKRAGLLRVGARPHAPGGAGGYNKPTAIQKKKKKIKKLKIKAPAAKPTASAAAAVNGTPDDADMFALAIPAIASNRQGKKKRRIDRDGEAEMVEQPAAFEDNGKEDMFRKILQASANAAPRALIPADEHRARMEELRRAKAERTALRAERFAAHKKC